MSYIDKHLSGEAKAKLGKEALFKRVNWYKLKQVGLILVFLIVVWFLKDGSSHSLVQTILNIFVLWGIYEVVLKSPLFVFLFGYIVMIPWKPDSKLEYIIAGSVIMVIGLLSALLKQNREGFQHGE